MFNIAACFRIRNSELNSPRFMISVTPTDSVYDINLVLHDSFTPYATHTVDAEFVPDHSLIIVLYGVNT